MQIILKKNLQLVLFSFLLLISSCGKVQDVDNNEYRTIKIGTQTWMAENLRVTHYRDGSLISNLIDKTEWANSVLGAYSDFNNNTDNGMTYGHLYNWYAVNDSRNIAPKGWHVATQVDWNILINYLGKPNAGVKLRESGTAHWKTSLFIGTNESGFTALPASYRGSDGNYPTGDDSGIGAGTAWWAISDSCSPLVLRYGMGYNYPDVTYGCGEKNYGYSIRCVKD